MTLSANQYFTPVESAIEIQDMERMSFIIARKYDIDNIDASYLPFIAFELGAFAYTTILGERVSRQLIKISPYLNKYKGFKSAMTVFSRAALFTFNERFNRSGGKNISLELYISPPTAYIVSAGYISWVVRVSKLLLPVSIELNAVHISSRLEETIYYTGAVSPYHFVVNLGGDI